jgi:hypothetical protein
VLKYTFFLLVLVYFMLFMYYVIIYNIYLFLFICIFIYKVYILVLEHLWGLYIILEEINCAFSLDEMRTA